MKKLALLAMAVGGFLGLGTVGGCASPAYTGAENVGRTFRTWDYENKQMIDDIMYESMWTPPSHGTIWNLR